MSQSPADYDRIRDRELTAHLDAKYDPPAPVETPDEDSVMVGHRVLQYLRERENEPILEVLPDLKNKFGIDGKRAAELVALYMEQA